MKGKVAWKVGLWECYTVAQDTATTHPLALVKILEKILATHWYTWLSSLLSATIIYTKTLLHCKRRKLERDIQTERAREQERERERERVTCVLSFDKQNVCNYVSVRRIKEIFNLFAVVVQVGPRNVGVKIRFFFFFFNFYFVRYLLK